MNHTSKVDLVGVGLNATDTLIRLPHYPALGSKVEFRSADVLPGGQVATAVAACQPFDFVLAPVAPVVTYAAEWASPTNDPATTMEHIAFTLPYNMSEQPAASIDCGTIASGLPIGLQIIGQRFDDLGVLQAEVTGALAHFRVAWSPAGFGWEWDQAGAGLDRVERLAA